MIILSVEKRQELIKATQQLVEEAIERGDGPFAAVLIDESGTIIESATNTTRTTINPTAHAEINLISKAKKANLSEYGVVVNAAPCPMCMTGLIKAKVRTLYYGAPPEDSADPYITPEEIASKSKHKIEIVSGILADECKQQIARGKAKLLSAPTA